MATKADLARLYVEIRDRRAARKAEFDTADNQDAEIQRKIELVLISKMDEEGEESFKTEFGTAYITSTDFAQVAAWPEFLSFIQENDAYDMLEKRCAKTAIREYIDTNKQVPPGINYGTRRGVNVRRPTKRNARPEADESEET